MKAESVLSTVGCLVFVVLMSHAEAGETSSGNTVPVTEWLVPWEDSRPRDPYVAADGRVWFVGQRGHYVANLQPETGEFRRYDLDIGTGPHNLVVDENLDAWYAGNLVGHIGFLDSTSGSLAKVPMPLASAHDPHTLVFDESGDIWFTVQHGNQVGKLFVEKRQVKLVEVPTKSARPYGIVVDAMDVPWAAEFGSNKLLRISPDTMIIEEIELPDETSRPRRLVTTSDGAIWYGDYARGYLGRYDPRSKRFSEWPMPSGADSRPYGMAVDRDDRIWIVETGVMPNRFVGFDPQESAFFSETVIPSGGGSVRHMHYFEPAGEVWFGTDTNRLGRARVH